LNINPNLDSETLWTYLHTPLDILAIALSCHQWSQTGNAPHWGCRLPDSRQSRNEQHFQPEAGNEILKGFWLNLTPLHKFDTLHIPKIIEQIWKQFIVISSMLYV
ncbi:MAG: hypothetical protein ACYTXC_24205, partial [Nostoc sp.]